MNEWTSVVESCFLPVGRENLGVWVLICYGQPFWFFTCKHSTVRGKNEVTVRRRRDDSERPAKKKNVLRQTFLSFFSKRHLFLIFVVLQIKIIHVSTSYDRSHLLQPCGKFLSWASPIPLGNFYPLAPPPPRNFH